jgi:hypothetical protein
LIRIRETQKYMDPTDPDSDPDPQHCLKYTVLTVLHYILHSKVLKTHEARGWCLYSGLIITVFGQLWVVSMEVPAHSATWIQEERKLPAVFVALVRNTCVSEMRESSMTRKHHPMLSITRLNSTTTKPTLVYSLCLDYSKVRNQ